MSGWRLAHLPVLLPVSSGLLLVAASYLVSTLLIARADAVDPRLVLPVGLSAYVVKYTAIGVLMVSLTARGWDGLVPMGCGVVAGVVGWTTTHIWWVVRHPPRLRYLPPGGADGSRTPG